MCFFYVLRYWSIWLVKQNWPLTPVQPSQKLKDTSYFSVWTCFWFTRVCLLSTVFCHHVAAGVIHWSSRRLLKPLFTASLSLSLWPTKTSDPDCSLVTPATAGLQPQNTDGTTTTKLVRAKNRTKEKGSGSSKNKDQDHQRTGSKTKDQDQRPELGINDQHQKKKTTTKLTAPRMRIMDQG